MTTNMTIGSCTDAVQTPRNPLEEDWVWLDTEVMAAVKTAMTRAIMEPEHQSEVGEPDKGS